MRLYAEVAKRSFRRWSTYRAATLAGIFTNSVFGFIRASVLLAVVKANPGAGGLTVETAITFSVLTQALLAFTAIFGDGDEIGQRVRTGDVVCDLYRPSDFQLWYLAADVGRGIFQLVGRSIPILVIGWLVYGLALPSDPGRIGLVVVALVGALLTGFGLRFLTSMSAFWLLDTRGTNQLMVAATLFGAGLTVPLGFFPDWLERIVRALPFAGILQTPADIFLGIATGADAINRLLVQFAWVVVLLVLGRLAMQQATRRVVIQGG